MIECVCPMLRGGGINHTSDCGYMMAKRGDVIVTNGDLIEGGGGLKAIGKSFFLPMSSILMPGILPKLDMSKYAALKGNIKVFGVLVPIAVTYNLFDENYTIIDGYLRWRATKNLNRDDIPARVWA